MSITLNLWVVLEEITAVSDHTEITVDFVDRQGVRMAHTHRHPKLYSAHMEAQYLVLVA